MINVSREFKQHMEEDRRNFLVYLDITLGNGTVLQLDDSKIWMGSFKIDDGVTQSGNFTIGSCIINKLTVTLNNMYDEFSPYDFDGAAVIAYLGMKLSDGKIEKIRKGIYTVDDPQYNGTTITLECLDNMSKFDVDYSNISTVYPTTIGEIVSDICMYCGVELNTPNFPNHNYKVLGRPDNEALSCRQMLLYCAQIAGCFGRCDVYGRLNISWFAYEIFEQNDNLDGGIFDDGSPYISGDVADGGDFDDYSSGVTVDGGTFDDLDTYHHLYSMSSFNVSTDDVVITGIEVTDEFTETEKDKKQTVLVGAKGYILSVSGNKLIQKGAARQVAEFLADRMIGLKFRPMSTQVLGDPTVEAGDLAYVTDRKQNTYGCLITNLSFNLGGFMNVSCDAETPSKNSSKMYSELTQAIVEIRREAQKQSSSLAAVMAQSFGVFKTEEAQEDGSVIYYMHDKPTLEESMCIWKFTAGAFAVSTDGGETWNAGMDASGNATVNILSAIGINCDWIHAGTLTLGGYNNQNGRLVMQDSSGREIGHWDKDGVYAKGRYICEATANWSRMVEINNGSIRLSKLGGGDSVFMDYSGDSGIIIRRGGTFESVTGSRTLMRILKDSIYFDADNVGPSGLNGKTGRAEFSDGSYLEFRNGFLIGGRTASGSSF